MPSFRVAAAGRRFPQLIARVCELTESMTRLGLGGDIYTKSFAGAEPDFDPEKIPELQPYRDLQTSRLTLYGRAHWDITSYLTDELIMPFREPRSLLVDRVPELWDNTLNARTPTPRSWRFQGYGTAKLYYTFMMDQALKIDLLRR